MPIMPQERDLALFDGLFYNGGAFTRRQIHTLFFPQVTQFKNTKQRLMKLVEVGYLKYADIDNEEVFYLGKKGADLVAQRQGKKLWKDPFTYVRKPRKKPDHDLGATKFMLDFAMACQDDNYTEMVRVVPEINMRHILKRVECVDLEGRPYKRGVVPDGYIEVTHKPKRHLFKFPIEYDTGNWRDPGLTLDKLIPMMEYIYSEAFKALSGGHPARWLFVTERGLARVRHLKTKVEKINKTNARNFLFTTCDLATPKAMLNKRIWFQGGNHENGGRVRLFEN